MKNNDTLQAIFVGYETIIIYDDIIDEKSNSLRKFDKLIMEN